MEQTIKHKGRVVAVHDNSVDVAVEAEDACAMCKAKDFCVIGDGKEKLISIYTQFAYAYAVGEIVEVSLERTMGMKAVTIAYIVPFLFVLTVLLVMLNIFKCSELLSGSVALGILVLYYLVLYLFRNKIEKDIVFKIQKI